MPNSPVCLFTFAASKEGSLLPAISREWKGLEDALDYLDKNNALRAKFHPATEVEDLFRLSKRHYNQLQLFHYSGHSSDDFIQLQDKHLRAQHFATLLGVNENLHLVFLNSCRSKEIGQLLRNKGVRVIIATSENVFDEIAADFSIAFYGSLAAGMSIKSAFKVAELELKDMYPQENISCQRRGFGRETPPPPEDTFHWDLFYEDEQDVEWTLPQEVAEELVLHPATALDEIVNVQLFDFLVKGLLDQIPEVDSTELQRKWNEVLQEDKNIIFSDIQRDVLKWLPVPLPRYLLDIIGETSSEKARSEVVKALFRNLGQLLLHFSLAELWQLFWSESTDSALRIPYTYWKSLHNYFLDSNKQRDSWGTYLDVCQLIKHNQLQFSDNTNLFKIKTPEVIDFGIRVQSDHSLYASYRELAEDIRADNGLEDHLAKLLGAVAFLGSFELHSIADISAFKSLKASSLRYKMKLAHLVGDRNDFRVKDLQEASFPCHQAVLLRKRGVTDYEQALFLPPFILDKNTFLKYQINSADRKADIHFLIGITEEGLHYQRANDEPSLLTIPTNIGDPLLRIRQGHPLYNHDTSSLSEVVKLAQDFFADLQPFLEP